MPVGQVKSQVAQHVLESEEATLAPSPWWVGYHSIVTVKVSLSIIV